MKVLCILMALLFSGFCLSEKSVKDQFYQAAKAGDIEEIQALKQIGFNINDNRGSGLAGPALNRAVKEGDIEAVEILLDMGASVHIEGWETGYPLHIAAKAGDVKMIRLLHSRGANVDAVNKLGYSPVHSTAWFGHISSLKVLNELGAGIHKKVESNGESLLHLVARRGHPEFIELLVSHFGVEVDVRNHSLYTPLHEAVRMWSFESVKKLVELGADIYARSRKGTTPLGLARKSSHADMKEFLTQAHKQHKQEGSAKALSYESAIQVQKISDFGEKSFNRFSSFINSCQNLLRRFVLLK